jgi:anionic cell wall polymer biosynthesis LytR-Cps2A-Psr (LCP) family protein
MTLDDAKEGYLSSVLESGGAGIHLNGMQTLGYARIRKLDSDYARAERQRKVLNLLMIKLKGKSTMELMNLAVDSMGIMRTNLDLSTIMTLGQKVLSREGFSGASTFVIPVQGTYKEEKRNDDAMLWDVDFEANKRELHAFIYLR